MDRMMRKLAMAMVVSGALGSSFASAMGLGEIKMNSALNQPLDAEVMLLNVGGLSENEILPNLASHQDFSRAGVERVFFLTGIKFDVELDGKGGAVLHLSTDRIVREPFLNFLIELHWPSGRLLREYTALLDPPLFSEAAAAPVHQAVTAAPTKVESAPQSKIYSTPTVTQSSVQSAPTSTTSDKRDGTVRVKKNDTLWGIAKENRPDSSVTVRQTMVAIQQHNPQAFIKNNINLLKSGQVLRIPEADEIRRVSSGDAYAETVRQTEEWRGKKTIDATQSYDSAPSSSSASTDQGGLLKLVAADTDSVDDSADENAAGGSAADDQVGSGGQAGITGETGSGSSVENVDELEKQLQDLQRLMTLKQEQLALSQATKFEEAAEAELATAETEATVVADGTEMLVREEALAGELMPTDEALVSETSAEAGADASAIASESDETVVAEEPLVDVEEAAAQEPRPEEGIMAILMNNPLYIGVLLVVILGGLILLGAISRRRKEEKEYPQDLQETMAASDNDVELSDDLVDVDDNEAVADIADTEPLLSNDELADDGADARKLLEEADIYIAYGRYERAIEILQPAVNDAPKNTELHLKLAEIFLASKDQARFSQQEADLQAIGDRDALANLDELKIKYADSSDMQPESVSKPEESIAEAAVEFETFNVEKAITEEPKYEGAFELDDIDFDLSDTGAEEVVSEAGSVADNLVEFETDASDDFFDIDAEESVDEPLEFSLDDGIDDQPQTEIKESGVSADDMDFLVDTDESATKLELAKAYIDMADTEAAQEILNEVVSEGSEDQQSEAKKLLDNLV